MRRPPSPWVMAWRHFVRQRLSSVVLTVSLSLALACGALIVNLQKILRDRYDSIPTSVQAVIGPKAGGAELLLGSLHNEIWDIGVMPENLYQTLARGADLHFEDGRNVSSRELTQAVVPLLRAGKIGETPVFGTTEEFGRLLLSGQKQTSLTPNANPELVLGADWQKHRDFQIGQELDVSVDQGTDRKIKIGAFLPIQGNAFDQSALLPLATAQQWWVASHKPHPIWGSHVLSAVLLQLPPSAFPPLSSLINDRSVSKAIWVASEVAKVKRISGSTASLGGLVVVVVFLLVGFAVIGMLSIRAETQQLSIATLQALGFSRLWIAKWLLGEAVLVGLCAGLVSLLLEFLGWEILQTSLNDTWLLNAQKSPTDYGLVAAGVVFAILASGWPIWRLTQTRIHQELKSS